ncbi:MAG: hypothetical protein A3H98_06920 [Bacteroidetes bacterium RIFCSPLOWO2_02_FULL_36_8]|nr:MAG: hypothetical protein A3H98_06920 [Bacteroidetes bacterium RIFCSPLOWO2_02_FULL_36_8]OFY70444.1 MAG: hypothetical protein A3G23_09970 [Bacteroidetes bacterium RIFCSPLOWO2_12_FULL_37_12]
MQPEIYGILISMLFSAFFSGIEIAFLTVSKFKIELKRKKGHTWARIIHFLLLSPPRYLGTILIGNTVSLVIYGVFAARFLEPFLTAILPDFLNNPYFLLILQTVLATAVVLITAEFLPKSIFRINPEKFLTMLAFPMFLFFILFYPAVFILSLLSKTFMSKIFNIKFEEEKLQFGAPDLDLFLRDNLQNQRIKNLELEPRVFQNALNFKNIRVKECMVPRIEISAVSLDDPIDELKVLVQNTHHSRILIYRGTIDHVVGFTRSIELFKNPKNIQQILYPVIIIPETFFAHELLNQFIQEQKNIAVVVDEYGGTAGLVTLEDIIEEIFGDIEDEHDEKTEILEQKIDDHTFIFSAKIEIDYLNERYKFNIPEGNDYETLGGYIISVHENIPDEKEKIEIYPYLFEVLNVSETRIEKVKMTLLNPGGV